MASPSTQRTTGTQLVLCAVLGAGVSFLLVNALEYLGQAMPRVPVSAAILIAVLAALVGALAYWTHQHVQIKREVIEATRALSLLVLGKTSLMSGVGLAAAYTILVVTYVPSLDLALPRERVINSAVAAAAAVALAVAGWALERACVLPFDPDDTGEIDALPGSSA